VTHGAPSGHAACLRAARERKRNTRAAPASRRDARGRPAEAHVRRFRSVRAATHALRDVPDAPTETSRRGASSDGLAPARALHSEVNT